MVTVPAKVARDRWLSLLIPLSFVLASSLAIDALVREWVPAGRSFWIVRPILYIARGQNLDVPSAVALPLGMVACALIILLVWTIRTGIPHASPLLEWTAALVLGGAFANFAEILTVGTVTDFLGIRWSGGVYSAGDLFLDIGLAIFPLLTFMMAALVFRRGAARIVGAFAYAVIVVFGITNPRSVGVAILATGIAVLASAVAFARERGR